MLEQLHFGDEAPEGLLARRPSKLMRPNRQRRFGLKGLYNVVLCSRTIIVSMSNFTPAIGVLNTDVSLYYSDFLPNVNAYLYWSNSIYI